MSNWGLGVTRTADAAIYTVADAERLMACPEETEHEKMLWILEVSDQSVSKQD